MSLRPLYVGIHFYLPHGPRAHALRSAVNHARYIVNPRREDFVPAEHHARYMHQRPGSAGLFGPEPDSPPELSNVILTLEHHTGPIWRLIVSVTEDDARTLTPVTGNLLTQRRWAEATRCVMPQVSEELHLRNVQWVSAMHRKDGHPHIHLLFWEEGGERQQGRLSPGERRGVRQWWMKELYGPMRRQLEKDKQNVRQQIVQSVREFASLTPPPSSRQQQRMVPVLREMGQLLPKRGRMALRYMSPPLRSRIRTLTEQVLRETPPLQELAQRYITLAEELAKHQSDDPEMHRRAKQNAWEDLVSRSAPVLMRAAAHARETSVPMPAIDLLPAPGYHASDSLHSEDDATVSHLPIRTKDHQKEKVGGKSLPIWDSEQKFDAREEENRYLEAAWWAGQTLWQMLMTDVEEIEEHRSWVEERMRHQQRRTQWQQR